MPRRPRILALVAICLALAVPLRAQTAPSLEQQIVAELAAQGFAVTGMERTWLGRLRVVAEDGQRRREIVVDPATGEVLQDHSRSLASLRAGTDDDDDDDDEGGGNDQGPATVTAAPDPGATVLSESGVWANVVAEPDGVSVILPEITEEP